MEAQKKRRMQVVKKACQLCRKGHRACDDQRPCSRCFKKGLECVDDDESTVSKSNNSVKPPQPSQIPLTQLLQQHQQQAFPVHHFHNAHFHPHAVNGSIHGNNLIPLNPHMQPSYPSPIIVKSENDKSSSKVNNRALSINANGGLIHLNPITFSNSNNYANIPYSLDTATTSNPITSMDTLLMSNPNTNNSNNTISLSESDTSFSSWMPQQVFDQSQTQNDPSKNGVKVGSFEDGIETNESQSSSFLTDYNVDVSVFFNPSGLVHNGATSTSTSTSTTTSTTSTTSSSSSSSAPSSSQQNPSFSNGHATSTTPNTQNPFHTQSPFSPLGNQNNQTNNSNQFPKIFGNHFFNGQLTSSQIFSNSPLIDYYGNPPYLSTIMFGQSKENHNQFYAHNNNNNSNNQHQALQAQIHELKDMVNTQGQVISRLLNYIKSYHSLESGVHNLANDPAKFNINISEFFKRSPMSRDFPSSHSLSVSSSLSFPVPLSPTDEGMKRIAQSLWDLNSLRILGCNQSFCDLTGYTMDEFVNSGFLCTQLVPDRLVQNTVLLMLKLSAGSAKYVEAKTMVKTKNGAETCCLLKARVSLELQQLYVQHVFIEFCDDEYRIDDLIHFASFKTKQCCRVMAALPAPEEKKLSCCCATTPTPSCCDLHFTLNAMG